MGLQRFLALILGNESLTRGLGDPEARILIEWLVEQAEWLTDNASGPEVAEQAFQRLCSRARSVGRFVHLWCYAQAHGAACQLAAAERFYWPLPCRAEDPCELMTGILRWEQDQERLWNNRVSQAA